MLAQPHRMGIEARALPRLVTTTGMPLAATSPQISENFVFASNTPIVFIFLKLLDN